METNKNNEEEYLKEISPRLFEDKIKFNPEPPEGYFESFAEKLNEKLPKPAETKVRRISVVNIRNLAIAASVAALIALIPFFSEKGFSGADSENETYTALADLGLDIDDVSDYLDTDLIIEHTIDSEDLIIENTSEFNESEIVTFLMDEDISEDLIINETILNEDL